VHVSHSMEAPNHYAATQDTQFARSEKTMTGVLLAAVNIASYLSLHTCTRNDLIGCIMNRMVLN
jgi:hypothetical protein